MNNISHWIDGYTGNWQEALHPHPCFEVGERLAIAVNVDARERDDLQRLVRRAGKELRYIGSGLEGRFWDYFEVCEVSA